MNRKQRRTQDAKDRKATKKAVDEASDEEKALIKAQRIQDEVQKAVKRSLGNAITTEDMALVINTLGMTAAGLACQIGVSESEFVGKMSIYMKQVRKAVGLEDEDPGEQGPSLILP